MEYKIFRLTFSSGVHFGEDSLEDNDIQLHADTIFSALCIEALKTGGETRLNELVSYVQADKLLISDAFPYMIDEYYLPKPMIRVNFCCNDDSANKKLFKKLKYIPSDMVGDYISGKFSMDTVNCIINNLNNKLGKSSIVARAAIRTLDDTLPYHVGTFTFSKDTGLYIITGCDDSEAFDLLNELLRCLAHTGVGGKRSSGLGRFSVDKPIPADIKALSADDYPAYMTLSVSLPSVDEIEIILKNAAYSLIRRSGFVFSETYSDEPLKKNDLYVLDSGSVVGCRFKGGVYDVSNSGAHPVYRYAKPLFLGVAL